VPGIKYVVDSGLARISRYSLRGKVQRLPIEHISQASADQRKGRCGRESEGICIRLYAEDEFNLRDAFTPPEILRTNLASVILQMAVQGLGEPEDFPFVDPPDTRQINDGYRLLQELKAVDDARRVTALGKQVASLPIDPRLARMLIAASHLGCVAEMLVLTAFLASQDPRERPQDAQAQADQKHAAFADSRSDFITVLNLWKAFREQSEQLSNSQLRKWCRENFLSYIRVREWQELHRQLSESSAELSLTINSTPADYAQFHQAVLTGFLGSIGSLQEKREYAGARGTRFVIAPGTPLATKPPQWIVAASLMETTRVYARMVAAVEPPWIESAGAHLIKRTHSEPHWVEDRGFVAALESVSLYGLILSAQRRINFGAVAPRAAQEIFVREALVEGRSRLRADFLDHNRELRRDIERREAKIRRRDILVDDQTLCDFYLARLPEQVNSLSTLDKWLRGGDLEHGAKRGTPPRHHNTEQRAPSLRMTESDVMRRQVPELTVDSHPDALRVGDNWLPLEYRFEPALTDDGLTVVVPEPLLRSLDSGQLAWLVPGWRVDKLTAVIRALPKQVRRSLVPAPDYAVRAAAQIDTNDDFHTAVAQWIQQVSGESITPEDVAALPLPDYLRMTIRVLDVQGNTIAQGRDLLQVRRTVRHRNGDSPAAKMSAGRVFRSWEFDELALTRTVERRGLRFDVFPTLRDHGDGVELFEASSGAEAQTLLRQSILRLLMLALPEQHKYARKRFAAVRELALLGQGMNLHRPLADALAERVFIERFLSDDSPLPRDRAAFQTLLDSKRADFGEIVDRIEKHSTAALGEARTARSKLAALQGATYTAVISDIQQQLDQLLPADFPGGVSDQLWPHLPRYFKALNRRLAKLGDSFKRDAELMAQIAPFARAQADASKAHLGAEPRPELERLRWMIEEYRVSLFAQDLRTAIPVSDKRLAEQAAKAKAEAARG
jgi:ATP-dependent helicase HrpA